MVFSKVGSFMRISFLFKEVECDGVRRKGRKRKIETKKDKERNGTKTGREKNKGGRERDV